jgi:hypothetical protein
MPNHENRRRTRETEQQRAARAADERSTKTMDNFRTAMRRAGEDLDEIERFAAELKRRQRGMG